MAFIPSKLDSRQGLGVAPAIVPAAAAAAKSAVIASAISKVKSLFGSKPKTYTPGAQRKSGGYQQEYQEGSWWTIPQYAEELWVRHIILALAEAGYPAEHAEVKTIFDERYDAIIRGKHRNFVRQVPMYFNEANMPYTGKGMTGIQAYMESESKNIAREIIATLPPGSTLQEAQAAADAAYAAEMVRNQPVIAPAVITPGIVALSKPPAPLSEPGAITSALPVESNPLTQPNPYLTYSEAQLKSELAAVDAAIAYRQSKGLSLSYPDMPMVELYTKKALIMAALTPMLVKKYGLYAAGGLTLILVLKMMMDRR